MEFQTRSEVSGLVFYESFEAALKAAKKDVSIWKISFTLPTGERVRLVRQAGEWVYEPIPFYLGEH